ncbi:hypothetical protein ABBQ32_012537 [Trebouxia sp. C0010 RCD-2024]
MRRGRAPADNSDVLAMFRLEYSGAGATQPLVDDASLTKEQKWQLLFDRNWQSLAPSSQTKWLVYLRKWQKWIDDHPEQPEGYLVFPSSKVSAFLSHILADCTASSSKDPHGAVKSARKALRHLRACQAGIPDDGAKFPSQPYIAGVTSRAKMYGNNFMTNHAFGRGTVAVPVKWIDSLVPHARVILQAVRLRNRTRTGKADFSGQHCVESTLYLAETFWQSSPFMLQRYSLGWWALQLPTVCFIVGSASFRQFEQQVMNAELEWNARPLSPQMTEAFDKISKQVCSLSEQIAHLQLSVSGRMQPVHSQTAANLSMPTASSSNAQARAATSPRIELEAQVGLSSGLSSVHEAVDEWFTGLHGFPAPPLLCEQAIQRGQRLSKKAIDNLSRRRHLPLRIQALATDRCWPLKKALAVYELVMQRHSLSLAELRDAVRLSSPVRHPNAKGGKPAQSQHVNRSPGLPLISISQFAAWVQKATDDIASTSISW